MSEPFAIPSEIATCPECNAKLWCFVEDESIELDCEAEDEWLNDQLEADLYEPELDDDVDADWYPFHKHHQSDWQPVIDTVRKWIETKAADDEAESK